MSKRIGAGALGLIVVAAAVAGIVALLGAGAEEFPSARTAAAGSSGPGTTTDVDPPALEPAATAVGAARSSAPAEPAGGRAPAADDAPRPAAEPSRAAPGEGLRGRVLERNGSGVAGATVALLGWSTDWLESVPAGMRPAMKEQMEAMGMAGQLQEVVGSTRTEADGRFALELPRDGDRGGFWLRVEAEDRVPVSSAEVADPAGLGPLSVTLEPAATVEVTIRTPDGSPVRAPTVQLEVTCVDRTGAPVVRAYSAEGEELGAARASLAPGGEATARLR